MIRTSETTAALFKALVAASKDLSAVPKTKKSQGEKISYTYATLDSVIDMLRSVLPKHGVWFLQQLSSAESGTELFTRIIHESGEWVEDSIIFEATEVRGGASNAQKIGASITYFRRYALCAAFGVCADDDTDGEAARPVRAPQPQRPQPQQAAQPTQPAQSQGSAKQNPTPFLMACVARRMKEGETKQSVLSHFAEMLKTDVIHDVTEMSEADKAALARILWAQGVRDA